MLVDAIDEVREELSWLTRNGLPSREPLPPVPVLKQMALDPCAEDWGDRLVIERGEPHPPSLEQTEPAESHPVEPQAQARPGLLF